jgi:nicotinic acid mononucleotide adenylyltransferase
MIITQGTHNRSEVVAVLGVPSAIPPHNNNTKSTQYRVRMLMNDWSEGM